MRCAQANVPHDAGRVFDKEKRAFTTEECLGTGTNLKTLERQNRGVQISTMPDEESSIQRSTIIIVHAEQNSQLVMGRSRLEEES
ncbi:hypothetical protein A2U01_0053919 [Trifolium medium]|uniref:Uncharacterized protein n=1 Tax=Trifolium medium TaxID=97028 RepID=A0A392RAX0_9FABA|nr:hypothetical protein [Trifolium medium]